ncbi:MAG: hypothetical protein PHR68_00480 [Candidatus Gracilibacteria bacterium]|nr:hypothetical protein [Candidatus Gracilibacteria bacterium]
MKKKLLSSLLHILLFVVIEICFVFIILHEFPEIGLFEKLGVVHLIYWILVFIAGYIRESIENYKIRFLTTFLPVVFHILGHLYIGEETIHQIEKHSHASEFWLIISTIILGIFIFVGEYLLHKRYHCESHHHKAHKHCKEE